MTDKESAGVLFMMISPHIITVRRIKKAALIRRRSHPRYQSGLFWDRICSLFGGGIHSLRHHGGNGDLANCQCSRIHQALPDVDLRALQQR